MAESEFKIVREYRGISRGDARKLVTRQARNPRREILVISFSKGKEDIDAHTFSPSIHRANQGALNEIAEITAESTLVLVVERNASKETLQQRG